MQRRANGVEALLRLFPPLEMRSIVASRLDRLVQAVPAFRHLSERSDARRRPGLRLARNRTNSGSRTRPGQYSALHDLAGGQASALKMGRGGWSGGGKKHLLKTLTTKTKKKKKKKKKQKQKKKIKQKKARNSRIFRRCKEVTSSRPIGLGVRRGRSRDGCLDAAHLAPAGN